MEGKLHIEAAEPKVIPLVWDSSWKGLPEAKGKSGPGGIRRRQGGGQAQKHAISRELGNGTVIMEKYFWLNHREL